MPHMMECDELVGWIEELKQEKGGRGAGRRSTGFMELTKRVFEAIAVCDPESPGCDGTCSELAEGMLEALRSEWPNMTAISGWGRGMPRPVWMPEFEESWKEG